jgi:hypothetical protein
MDKYLVHYGGPTDAIRLRDGNRIKRGAERVVWLDEWSAENLPRLANHVITVSPARENDPVEYEPGMIPIEWEIENEGEDY